jgi:hypothetical protein
MSSAFSYIYVLIYFLLFIYYCYADLILVPNSPVWVLNQCTNENIRALKNMSLYIERGSHENTSFQFEDFIC